jgi:DNA topoisomerase-3
MVAPAIKRVVILLLYTFADKKISENQYLRLLQKGLLNLKEFKTDAELLKFY